MGSSILPDHIEENRLTIAQGSTSASVQSLGIHNVSGGSIVRTKQALRNAGRNDIIGPTMTFERKQLQSMNDAEGLKILLRSYNCSVLTITHKNRKVMLNVSEINLPEKVSDELSNPHLGGEDAREWLEGEKSSLATNETDLLSIAWCSPQMRKLANAFPHSLSIDGTHKTVVINNMTHLTVTVKTSFGSTFVILRVFIPNQQTWMFRYILMVVIPNLLGNNICQKVKSFITDGDPQLCGIVDYAITTLYRNAKRKRCTWHVIDRMMEKYRTRFTVKKSVSKNFNTVFSRLLQRWLYTWYKPGGGINSEEEYLVSKAILLCLLDSNDIKGKFV